MRMHLNFSVIKSHILGLEKQSVTVGVLDEKIKAASIDHSKGIGAFSTLSGSTPKRYVKRKGRNKNITLKKLALILDDDRGIISTVLNNPNNVELIQIAQEFAKVNKTNLDIRRLENIARALVRNPIMRKDYGPNAQSTIHGYITDGGFVLRKAKGFDHYAFATGTLFKNIRAVYKKW